MLIVAFKLLDLLGHSLGGNHKSGGRPQFQRWGGASGRPKNNQNCTRCGYSRHQRHEKCPAEDSVCHGCNNKGHYSSQCFFKNRKKANLDNLEDNVDDLDDIAFLDVVSGNQKSTWTATVSLEGKQVQFKLDTGAAVTAITEETYNVIQCPTLRKSSKALYGPSNQELHVLGQFTGHLTYLQNVKQEDIYVIRGLKTDLLGLPAITSLHLVECLYSTEEELSDIKKQYQQQFPKVFNGLGTLGGEYRVKLREDAIPYALYAPRNVPISLHPKVREELQRMETLGVIQRVSQPTPWCAGMVVLPKKSGAIRICVDLKPLNESVLREVHPIPKVDDILAQLTGAKLFSKLDANSGFWQIPLAEASQLLTTFVTPYGRYCFNKLPFGISSAPELYQKRINQILEGLPGVLCLIDDVISSMHRRGKRHTQYGEMCIQKDITEVPRSHDRPGRHQSRSRQDSSDPENGDSQIYNGSPSFYGHGKPAGEILPQYL